MNRLLRRVVLFLGITALGTVGIVQLRWDRTFAAPYPAAQATTDPAVIERGRYLAYGPAHCAACHTPPDQSERLSAGEQPPLAGGRELVLPIGTFRMPNLTPDAETGLGRRSDAELARLLRHGVRHDGRAAFPAMGYQNLAEEDLVALISFLRSQPPVHNPVPEHEINPLGRAIYAFLLQPEGPRAPPPVRAPTGATIGRGSYLAQEVAGCSGCHTPRSMLTGAATGPTFSGGMELPDDTDAGRVFVTPNLTPDPETGRITGWSEDQFVARLRAGRVYPGTHMPWETYGRMSDDDLRAIYRFLRSLPPVENETGPPLRPAKP